MELHPNLNKLTVAMSTARTGTEELEPEINIKQRLLFTWSSWEVGHLVPRFIKKLLIRRIIHLCLPLGNIFKHPITDINKMKFGVLMFWSH